jgi:hypothetical protein
VAFPTIPTVANGRVLVTTQANTTSPRTFPTLSSLTKNSGDLLLAIIVGYESSLTSAIFSSWGASFTELKDIGVSTQHCLGVAYKWSDGTETGTFTVAQAGTITGHAAMILLSIPNAHLSTVPEILASLATDTAAAANPASLDPAGWGTEDTLWIAVGGGGETGTAGSFTGVTAAPTNYSNYAATAISSDVVGGVNAAVAFRQLNASSEDVGTFTVDTSNARNCATVIAVRPAPEAKTVSPSAIDSAQALGTTVVIGPPASATIATSAIASAEALGSVAIAKGNVNVATSAIASAEAFGTTTLVTASGPAAIVPSAIASAEAVIPSTLVAGGVMIDLN